MTILEINFFPNVFFSLICYMTDPDDDDGESHGRDKIGHRQIDCMY